MSIPTLLTDYLAAKARHAEARRLRHRANRTAAKLGERLGGGEAAWDRGWIVAGVDLADHRCLSAYREMGRAREALLMALCGKPYHTRLRVYGVVRCAELPRPANDSTFVAQRAQEPRG